MISMFSSATDSPVLPRGGSVIMTADDRLPGKEETLLSGMSSFVAKTKETE